MRIVVVNPNTSPAITALIAAAARRAASPATEVVPATAPFGPEYIASRSESAIAAHAVLQALAGHAGRCDGAVIAASTDSGLVPARELMPVPIVGMTEAAMLTACMLGGRFTAITIAPRLVPMLRELAESYGVASRLASVRAFERSAIDIARDPESVVDAFLDLVRAAVREDGADVVITGGSVLADLPSRLAGRLDVPVLDGVACAVRQVELLVGLGVRRARAGSFAPPGPKTFSGVPESLARLFGRASEC